VQPGGQWWRWQRRRAQQPLYRSEELPYIAGLAGGGRGYFVDQFGKPRMVWGDATWALIGNAGRWNGGDWRADFDGFTSNRAAQGFTVLYGKPMGTTQSSNVDDNGGTFDGLFPFKGGAAANPSTGLTEAYWQRVDYFLTACKQRGITFFFNAVGYASDFEGGPGPLAGKSAAEFTSYGTQLGNRYKNQPNIVWVLADDYFGGDDALLDAFLSGVRAAGDAHVVSVENLPESGSRNTFDVPPTVLPWGTANAQFNFVYSYNQEYYGVEQAYAEGGSPVPVIKGDGYFYKGNAGYSGGTGAFAWDSVYRQVAWWPLAAGARGVVHGSESIWTYQSTALAASATDWWYANNAKAIRLAVEALPGWQNLLPDLNNQLVTGGRGTRASPFTSGGGGGAYEESFTSAYVAASITPDHTLALLYLPRPTTITIDTSLLGPGFTATWIDPVNGATSSAGSGATYNSTAKGNNSQGDGDWALAFQGPFVSTAGVPQLQPGSPGWRKRRRRVQQLTADAQPVAAPPTPVTAQFTAAKPDEGANRFRRPMSGFAPVIVPVTAVASVPVPQFTRAQQPPQHQPQRRPAFISVVVVKPPLPVWTRARRVTETRVPRAQPQQLGSPPKALVVPVFGERAPPARRTPRGGFSRAPYVSAAVAVTPVIPAWTRAKAKPTTSERGEFTGPLSTGAPRPAPPSWLSGWTRAVRRPRTTVPAAQGFRRTPSPVTVVSTPVLVPFTRATRVISPRAPLRRSWALVVRVAPVTPQTVLAERVAPRLPRARGFTRVHVPAVTVVQVPALVRALRVTRFAGRRTLRSWPLGKGANPPVPPPWLGQRVAATRTHPRPPRRAAGFIHGHQPPPPQSEQLEGVWAGAPHGQWTAGEPHGSYASGEPQGQWTAGAQHG